MARGFGYFVINHYDKDGNLIYSDEGHNSLADQGEMGLLNLFFRATGTPLSFELALFNDTPVDTDTMSDITGEPTTNGYARQALARNDTDFPTLDLDSGDYQIESKTVTFSASGDSWGPVTYAVLIAKDLIVPTDLAITVTGASGSTTYGYRVAAYSANGNTLACTEVTDATGNATLSGDNYNKLDWTAVTGATGYRVYRSTGGATQGLIGSPTSNTLNDTGLTADGAVPTTDQSGRVVAYKALSQSRTPADGESIEVVYKMKLS